MKFEHNIIVDYAALCASRDNVETAKNLPERFSAALVWQGDLSAFVIHYPKALALGVDRIVEAERTANEYAREKVYGGRRQ
jgi:hypothetical protein